MVVLVDYKQVVLVVPSYHVVVLAVEEKPQKRRPVAGDHQLVLGLTFAPELPYLVGLGKLFRHEVMFSILP